MPYTVDTSITPLLLQACHTLSLSQRKLGELCRVSTRTAHRWSGGRSYPSADQVKTIAAAAYPVDPGLAERLAAAVGTTLVAWGIAAPAPPPPAGPPPRPFPPMAAMVDALVMAALDAADVPSNGPVSRHAVRAALRAAFSQARTLGLTLEEVDDALTPPASRAREGHREGRRRGG